MSDKKWIDLENWRCLKSFKRKNIELLVNRLLTLNALREEQRSVGNVSTSILELYATN